MWRSCGTTNDKSSVLLDQCKNSRWPQCHSFTRRVRKLERVIVCSCIERRERLNLSPIRRWLVCKGSGWWGLWCLNSRYSDGSSFPSPKLMSTWPSYLDSQSRSRAAAPRAIFRPLASRLTYAAGSGIMGWGPGRLTLPGYPASANRTREASADWLSSGWLGSG